MQRVGPVVDRELVVVAVQREASVGDAVGVAPEHRAEGSRLEHLVQLVEAEQDVVHAAVAVRRLDR